MRITETLADLMQWIMSGRPNHPTTLDPEAPGIWVTPAAGDTPAAVVKGLEELRKQPRRVVQRVAFSHPDTFVAYVRRFGLEAADVSPFVIAHGKSITAVIDYHEVGEAVANTIPRWCSHRADLTLERSTPWRTWLGHDGEHMSQLELAEFLEDNIGDVETVGEKGGPAELLDVCASIQASRSGNFSRAERQDNGDTVMSWAEETTATAGKAGKVKVPDRFTLKVPIFEGTPAVLVECRFRYRLRDGKLSLFYRMVQTTRLEEGIVEHTAQHVGNTLGLFVHRAVTF